MTSGVSSRVFETNNCLNNANNNLNNCLHYHLSNLQIMVKSLYNKYSILDYSLFDYSLIFIH